MRKPVLFSTVGVLLLLAACKKDKPSSLPSCIQSAVDSAMAKPVGSLYLQIDAYKYHDTTVYLYMTGCCDRFNFLKNENCEYLFSPSGGITGGGDHTHPDFFNSAVWLNTVWKDPRQ